MDYYAYKFGLNGKEALLIVAVTGEQRFFLACVQIQREKRTEQSLLSPLEIGSHAQGRYRALAPSNNNVW